MKTAVAITTVGWAESSKPNIPAAALLTFINNAATGKLHSWIKCLSIDEVACITGAALVARAGFEDSAQPTVVTAAHE
jgi:hypothetical protein